jgi:lipid-A-disaccharide synthase
MRYYIIAGERSGDLHGGNLVQALKQRDPQAIFRGFGGDHMESQGVEIAVHYKALAFMGLVEILTKFNKIKKYIQRCKEDIESFKPDVIILIDYGGFNLQIARFGKKTGYKICYYIPPKYWAWYEKRAAWLKPHVDKLFVILPFEKDFFKKFDWEANYVGNPVLDAVKAHHVNESFVVEHQLSTDRPIVALLPGSRKQELKGIIPLMASVVTAFPNYQFAVATVNNLDKELYKPLNLPNVKFIIEDTYNLLHFSNAAIVTSGTATLETALFKVPQVVVYKANPVSYWLAKQLIKVPYISLVNLIANREVVKERIQSDANRDSVVAELKSIMEDDGYRNSMISGYEEIIQILDTGSASENTARMIHEYLINQK